MTTFLIILLVVGAIGYSLYVTVIKRRNSVLEALSGIDTSLTQRHDMIPNMLEIAKSFMDHERGIMNEITALRNHAQSLMGARSSDDVKTLLAAETQLGGKMGQFFAVAENYPNLKSDSLMLDAQKAYRFAEDNLAASRRFYNSAVGDLNNTVQIFPTNIIADMLGIKAYPFYEAPAEHRADVNAADILRRAS